MVGILKIWEKYTKLWYEYYHWISIWTNVINSVYI